ncbi:metallophosphoesterase [Anaeromyxobacter sp. K]|uniref:metallophosphoesterase family protein n=1 Tax=Anaeromyxobacter sp. (strain K) TaxID=447217 RepID=UPI00015F84D0|nr:metallophosphoesterase family protein [Anaeromyxobacter sp. K]ACG74025.1 metallophosphoesterase [Anaeromyxobacter sp. K]
MAPSRTLVVGDVHGCLGELEDLLAAARYEPMRDRLVFLGDLVDRGPDPVGVVRRVRALGADCLLGNHEEKHLRYAAHEARRREDPRHRNPVRLDPRRTEEHLRLSPDDLAWMAALPRALRLDGGWLAVHGGLLPGRPLSRQPPDWLIRLRFLDASGKPVSREHGGEPGVVRWAERWTGPSSVVYGHHARDEVVVDEPAPGVRCVGIDTGCVYGGKLTALALPSGERVQVPSRQRKATPEQDD